MAGSQKLKARESAGKDKDLPRSLMARLAALAREHAREADKKRLKG